jgi:hypothetical protein
MNTENCGTGNQQSIGHSQAIKWSAMYYQLSHYSISKKWIMV